MTDIRRINFDMSLTFLGISVWLNNHSLREFEEQLEQFYSSIAVLDTDTMSHATSVLFSVIREFQKFLQTKFNDYPVGDFILSGSVSEGLKVIEPNEFDIMIPLLLTASGKDFEKVSPTKYLAQFKLNKNKIIWDSKWFDLAVRERYMYDERVIQEFKYLSPEKISKKIEELFMQIIKDPEFQKWSDGAQFSIRRTRLSHDYAFGPAAEFELKYKALDGSDAAMLVDFVPFVETDKIEKQSHVISPYYTKEIHITGGYGSSIYEIYADPTIFWRRSYSDIEKRLMDIAGEKVKKPLMIYKSIILTNANLKNEIFGSFHLKNIVLQLAFNNLPQIAKKYTGLDESYNIESDNNELFTKWTTIRLAGQIIEMTIYIQKFLKKGNMQSAFQPSVLVTFNPNDEKKRTKYNIPEIQDKMNAYLEDIIDRKDWIKLLKDSNLKVKPSVCPFKKQKISRD